jgi:integrase
MNHIFLNERGQQLSVNGIEWRLKRYGREVGLHLAPYQLRHTFARQLTDAGMPIISLGKLMGHSQIGMTQIYTAGICVNHFQGRGAFDGRRFIGRSHSFGKQQSKRETIIQWKYVTPKP